MSSIRRRGPERGRRALPVRSARWPSPRAEDDRAPPRAVSVGPRGPRRASSRRSDSAAGRRSAASAGGGRAGAARQPRRGPTGVPRSGRAAPGDRRAGAGATTKGRPAPDRGDRGERRGRSAQPSGRKRDRTDGAPRRGGSTRQRIDRAPRGWGSVARRGAGVVDEAGRPPRPAGRRPGEERNGTAPRPEPGPPPPWEPETWVREPDADAASARRPSGRARRQGGGTSRAGRRGAGPRSGRLPAVVLDELSASAGRAETRRLQQRLSDAAAAYDRDRYGDAARILRALVAVAPDSPSVARALRPHPLPRGALGRGDPPTRCLPPAHRLLRSASRAG